jgi:hypothetical protein
MALPADSGYCAERDCARCQAAYPNRSPLRCGLGIRRGLDFICSISQNIQTKAAPRAVTTIKNINVNAGAVSMFNIPDVTRTAFLQTTVLVTSRRSISRRGLGLDEDDAFAAGPARIQRQV